MTKPPSIILQRGVALEPGRMYARLFHGRNAPDQEMEGWGFAGPLFGPLQGASLTYLQHLRLHGTSCDDEAEAWSHDGLLAWDGSYYGDVYVFVAGEGDSA